MDEVLGIVVKDGEVVMRRRDPETGYVYDEPYYDGDIDDDYQLYREAGVIEDY